MPEEVTPPNNTLTTLGFVQNAPLGGFVNGWNNRFVGGRVANAPGFVGTTGSKRPFHFSLPDALRDSAILQASRTSFVNPGFVNHPGFGFAHGFAGVQPAFGGVRKVIV